MFGIALTYHRIQRQVRQRGKTQARRAPGCKPWLELLDDRVVPTLAITGLTPPTVLEDTAITGVQVATFTDSNSGTVPADYAAQIAWGDGEASWGTIAVNPGGGFSVTGDKPHPFDTAGYRQMMVTVADSHGGSTPGDSWIAAPLMPAPVPRYEFAATAGNDGKIYAMGGYGGAGAGNSMVAYNPVTASWLSVANLPTARGDLAATTGADGRIYALGGYTPGSPAQLSAVGQAYTPLTNAWANIANMPTARAYLGAATGADGRIFAIGGYDTSLGGYTSSVYAYTPSTNTWASVANMPTARGYLAAVTGSDGRIYAIGGYATSGSTAVVEAYSPSSNTWATLPSLPTARFSPGIAVAPDGRIYVIGGYDPALGGYTNTTYVYTPSNNTWSSGPNLGTPRAYLAAATAVDGRLYAMGGYGSTGLFSVEALGPERSLAQRAAPLRVDNAPLTVYGVTGQLVEGTSSSTVVGILYDSNLAAVVGDNSVQIVADGVGNETATLAAVPGSPGTFTINTTLNYAEGGYYRTNLTVTSTGNVATSTAWTQVRGMAFPRSEFTAVTGNDGRIYAISGTGGGNSAEAYTASTNTWAGIANLPAARFGMAGANGSDGRIYVIAGATSQGTLDTVLAYTPGANTWSSAANLPGQRYGLAAAPGQDGRIYAMGGSTSTISGYSNSVFAYTPSSNTWTTVASMPTARNLLAAVTTPDGRIFAMGGQTASGATAVVEVYTPSTNTWTSVASLPSAAAAIGAAVGADGRIYVMGPGATTWIYTPITNTWSNGPNLLLPRGYIAGATGPDGNVYSVGGYTTPGGPRGQVEVLGMVPLSTASASGFIAVADAPLVLKTVASPVAVAGSPVPSFTAATFQSANSSDVASELSASINWGDGEVTAGSITTSAPDFVVTGAKPNPYAQKGLYPLAVTVTDTNGGPAAVGAWAQAANMPGSRASLALVTGADGQIYEIGGFGPGGATNGVARYSLSNRTWFSITGLPTARYDLAGVKGSDDRIYAIGGINGSGPLSVVEATTGPTSTTWATMASLPTARFGHAAAVGGDGRIYVLGGFDPSLGGTTNSVYAYTPSTSTWTSVASMPTARVYLAAVTGFDGRIYAIGGSGAGGSLATVEVYTPLTNTWATVASLPAGRSAMAAAIGPDGRIYVMGGSPSGGTYSNTVLIYSPTSNSWSDGPNLTIPRAYLAATIGEDGNIYAAGGYGSGTFPTFEVLGANQATLTMTGTAMVAEKPPTLQTLALNGTVEGAAVNSATVASFTSSDVNAVASDFAASIAWGDGQTSAGTLAAAGGGFTVTGSKPAAYADEGSYPLKVTVGPSSWKPVANMASGRQELGLALGSDGRLYALGGYPNQGESTAFVSAYNPTTGTWSTAASMLTGRTGLAAASGSDGRIYALGGFVGNNFTRTASVEAYSPITNSWASVAPLPVPLSNLAAVNGSDGRIYALGGAGGSGFNNVVYAYTPSTNTWTTRANLPLARNYLAAVSGLDGRIYAIGGNASGGVMARVEAYSPITNQWTILADLPVALYGVGAAAGLDGRIYVMGGHTETAGSAGYSLAAYAYTPSTNSWSSLPNLSTYRSLVAASIGADGNIYAVGGRAQTGVSLESVEVLRIQRNSLSATSFVNVGDAPLTLQSLTPPSPVAGAPTGTVTVATFTDADPAAVVGDFSALINWGDGQSSAGSITLSSGTFTVSGSKPSPYASPGSYPFTVTITDTDGGNLTPSAWTSVASMPAGRYEHTAAQGIDGRIYAIGGVGSSGFLATVSAYTPATNSWTAVANLPSARYDLAAVAGVDGRIYALGGNTSGGAISSALAYSTSSNTWTAVASMPTARYAHAAVTGQDGRTYVIGGYDPSLGGYTNTVYAYAPGSNTWATVASMQVRRDYLAAATGIDGRIYAIGGYGTSGATSVVEAYNPASNTWTTLAPMPTARFGMGIGVAADGRLFVVGGYDPTLGGYTTSVYVYTPTTNTWSSGPALTTARAYLAAAMGSDGNLYALGGYKPGVLASVEALALNRSQIVGNGTVNVGNPPSPPPPLGPAPGPRAVFPTRGEIDDLFDRKRGDPWL